MESSGGYGGGYSDSDFVDYSSDRELTPIERSRECESPVDAYFRRERQLTELEQREYESFCDMYPGAKVTVKDFLCEKAAERELAELDRARELREAQRESKQELQRETQSPNPISESKQELATESITTKYGDLEYLTQSDLQQAKLELTAKVQELQSETQTQEPESEFDEFGGEFVEYIEPPIKDQLANQEQSLGIIQELQDQIKVIEVLQSRNLPTDSINIHSTKTLQSLTIG